MGRSFLLASRRSRHASIRTLEERFVFARCRLGVLVTAGASRGFRLALFLRSENLAFRLEPVVQSKSVNPAALQVQSVGASADAFLDVAGKVKRSWTRLRRVPGDGESGTRRESVKRGLRRSELSNGALSFNTRIGGVEFHYSSQVAIATVSRVVGLERDSVRTRWRPCLCATNEAPLLCDS